MAVENERQRYIGFVIEGGKTSRPNMISCLRKSINPDEYHEIRPWLTIFDGEKGIIRCRQEGKERLIDILNSLKVEGGNVKTLITSGTIKKVKQRLFDNV